MGPKRHSGDVRMSNPWTHGKQALLSSDILFTYAQVFGARTWAKAIQYGGGGGESGGVIAEFGELLQN